MAGFDDLIEAQSPSVAEQNLYLYQGATWRVGWTVKDGNEDLIDFGTCTARCDVKSEEGNSLLATWTNTVSQGRRIDLGAGTVTLYADVTATSGFQPGKYRYELEVRNLSGQVVKLITGKLRIEPEVTTSG